MAPVTGHLLFDVYENGQRIEPIRLSERIPSIFDDWQSEFEAPVLEHVLSTAGYSRTAETGMQKDFLDRVHFIRAQSAGQERPSNLTIPYNGKQYEVRFIGFIGRNEDESVAQYIRSARDRIAQLDAETARRREESLRGLENRVRPPPQPYPIGAGAGAAPVSREPGAARALPVSEAERAYRQKVAALRILKVGDSEQKVIDAIKDARKAFRAVEGNAVRMRLQPLLHIAIRQLVEEGIATQEVVNRAMAPPQRRQAPVAAAPSRREDPEPLEEDENPRGGRRTTKKTRSRRRRYTRRK